MNNLTHVHVLFILLILYKYKYIYKQMKTTKHIKIKKNKNFRFNNGELNVDLNEFQTNLAPFPRLYFLTTSMTQVISTAKAESEKNDDQKAIFNDIVYNTLLAWYILVRM